MPDSSLSTLQEIIIKVRRLTRSPSQSQLSDVNIGKYINTFVLYDFPENIKADSLKTTFSFYSEPGEDKYSPSDVEGHPLYNFNNKYLYFSKPIYVSGSKANFYKTKENFYDRFPLNTSRIKISTGDGIVSSFNGTLKNKPVLANNVLFSSKTSAEWGLAVYDDGKGNLVGDCSPGGTIDYTTGVYDFTFMGIPAQHEEIYADTFVYTASRPTSILFLKDSFFLRPVPDGVYKIEMEAFVRPTELLAYDQSPDLAEWWQYIAYGAAKKVFEDRMDSRSLSIIAAEFAKQEDLILSRTISKQSNLRTSTIYCDSGMTRDSWKTNPY